ncbi:MAG: hypothetical protein [Caudoviricetes sp.]|nr:MAG: hypothetical protein [Caudoviricetes sp.]
MNVDSLNTECEHRYTDKFPVIAVGQFGSIVIGQEICLTCGVTVNENIVDNTGNIEPKRDNWR